MITEEMVFWNGNKSPSRQRYELEVLETVLQATEQASGPVTLRIDDTDYPRAEDEASVFEKGVDALVTVAGNRKFEGKEKIEINIPIAKGLLGCRLLIVKQERLQAFSAVTSMAELARLSIGIPATWADADLFRSNGFSVAEKGSFADVFIRLKREEFDYVALGANEIEEAFASMAAPLGGLALESVLMIQYPFPLVFLVNPAQPLLAERISTGLKNILGNGELDRVFDKHYGSIVERLELGRRRVFHLRNPFLPAHFFLKS
ncbi:MAG TPA: hypothetical protein VK995_02500 [Oceanipulchritudo sp.]|nr:hypothetical protein [Oceanipulchritudo sp.]